MPMNAAIKPESIANMLAELSRTGFWGSITIDYQNGQPMLIRKTETIKTLESSSTGNTRHADFNK